MKKVVFITGGSRGIGLATAQKFVKNSWTVASFYNKAPGPAIEGVTYYQVDVSSLSSVQEAFKKALADHKQVDCLVNNAGITLYKKGLSTFTEAEIDRVIGVNEKGVYFCTKVVLETMKEGSIVNMSSSVSRVGGTDPLYTGTKAAVLGFTKSMAKTLAPAIRVNTVAPGVVNTDMMANYDEERKRQLIELALLKRMAEPEDVANAIYFLASDEARHITEICLDVSGGYVIV